VLAFYAVLGVAVTASSFVWAGLLQRARGGRAMATLDALLAVATLLPVLSASPWAAFASGLVFGGVFLSVVASTTALVRHNLPPAAWPAGIASFTVVFAAGQIVGPSLVGWVADTAGGGLRSGLVVSSVVLGWRLSSRRGSAPWGAAPRHDRRDGAGAPRGRLRMIPGSRFRRLALAALAISALGAAVPGFAQAPGAPVRLLVGFPAGGTIDVVARLLAESLKDDLGAAVIVDSRPGAGGQIAAQALKQAAADGRTLLLSPDHTMVMLPLTVRAPGFVPASDFVPIGQVARYAGGFAVAPGVKAANLREFFAWTRANAGQGNVGVPAPGSIPQFFVDVLAQRADTKLAAVPYRGSAPLVQDLMGGQIAAGTTALGDLVEPHAAGRMRVIAVLGSRRSPALPDVPTFAEQGYAIEWEYWLGLYAPAGTAAAEVQKLNAALRRALAKPEVRERMQRIVFEPAPSSPEELAALMRAGTALWEPIVRGSGWVPQ
jgi:tripartite-type tricarboxylate transporter receptor subunit TctC